MAYKSNYDEDSDADDEYERSVDTSTSTVDIDYSPSDSEVPSTENTPTTFVQSVDGHDPPNQQISLWTVDQCADFVSGLGLEQYADTFINEGISGDALIELGHMELKDMGMSSVGHRLTILKSVYEVKIKQNIPIEPDHYMPLCADSATVDQTPTQDDISRIIRIIKERDDRMRSAEAELRVLKDDLFRISEENRKLREDFLRAMRLIKERQPLPTPDSREGDHIAPAPPIEPRLGSSLSRKFSTKKLFLGGAPKNPSPTIHEGRTLTDISNLDPSAAAIAASSHLTASLSACSGTTQHSPLPVAQASPTSPAYSTALPQLSSSRSLRCGPESHGFTAEDHSDRSKTGNRVEQWTEREGRNVTTPLSSRPHRTAPPPSNEAGDPPLSGGSTRNGNLLDPRGSRDTAVGSTNAATSSQNPQVEIFKSFRVSIDDPCHKVLPVALKKYNIADDWRQYALYIVHGDQERCLGLEERPLILFKQLDKDGRKPMFMLRKHAPPDIGHVLTIQRGAQGSNAGAGAIGTGDRGWNPSGRVELPGGVL